EVEQPLRQGVAHDSDVSAEPSHSCPVSRLASSRVAVPVAGRASATGRTSEMDGRPFTYLERMAHDRQRQLIAEAEKLALAKSARRRARTGTATRLEAR